MNKELRNKLKRLRKELSGIQRQAGRDLGLDNGKISRLLSGDGVAWTDHNLEMLSRIESYCEIIKKQRAELNLKVAEL